MTTDRPGRRRRLGLSRLSAAAFGACCLLSKATAFPVLAQEAVRIAVAVPQAKPRVDIGKTMQRAAEDAVSKLNAAGGVDARPLVLTIVDDPCDASSAARTAATLASGGHAAVFGFACAVSAAAAGPVLAQAGTLFIATPSTPAPLWRARPSPFVFQLPVAERGQAAFLASKLAAAGTDTRIAIARDKTGQAVAFVAQFDAELRKAGRTATAVEIFAGGDKSFGSLTARLQAHAISHVVLVAFPAEGALVARELVAALPAVTIIGPDFLAAGDMPRLAGEAIRQLRVVLAAPRVMATVGIEPAGRSNPAPAPREASAVTAAIEAWAEAARRAGSTATAAVASALDQDVDTQLTTVRFRSGQALVPYWGLFRWRSGRLVEDEPSPN